MPVVFNTGEREPRPLFPDQVIYTSAQKVADILQVPYPDPAYLTADVSAVVGQKTSLKINVFL